MEQGNARRRISFAILTNHGSAASASAVDEFREACEPARSHDHALNGETALEVAWAEMRIGQSDLRASEAALASFRAEIKLGQAHLQASEMALAASQVETRIGLTDLWASARELAASRAETKISEEDVLAGAVALSLSRAETVDANIALRVREGQITSITKNQELLRHVVEASPTALILVGAAGKIAMVNAKAERLFGYSRAELHGKELEVLLPEKFRVGHARLRAESLARMASRAMAEGRELFGLRKDRTQFALEIGLTPIDLGGEAMVLAGITDITERLAAEAAALTRQDALEQSNGELIRARLRAEQATRAKSRFLAGMSHELRTPLNGILGYAQLLEIDGGLTALQSERVNAMRVAGQHLLEMITSVLDLSEVEAGRITLKRSSIDLRHLAQDCLDVVAPNAVARGLTLRLKIAHDVPDKIVADKMRLRQVLLNLLANAVKFTDTGSIDLQLSLAGGKDEACRLLIRIVDTGRGIPADRRAGLFQEFERLGANAAGAVEGAGLGLAISAHLVGLMGGCIVHADNPGGGSVFSFELNLDDADSSGDIGILPRGQKAAAECAAPRTPAPSLTVLIVDDIAMNRDIAASFLRAAGHDAVCADGGAAAIIAAEHRHFDFVLMDLRMPEMDGFEASRRIRAIGGKNGRVPIIALTAHAFADQIEACRRAGMSGHVSKPFTQATLLTALARAYEADIAGRAGLPPPAADIAALPVMDADCFETNMAFLSPGVAADHLTRIAASMEQNLRLLRAMSARDPVSNTLADSVHTLTGTIGMFGFVRAVDIGRKFERAARIGRGVPPALTAGLVSALDASLQEITVRKLRALDTIAALQLAETRLESA